MLEGTETVAVNVARLQALLWRDTSAPRAALASSYCCTSQRNDSAPTSLIRSEGEARSPLLNQRQHRRTKDGTASLREANDASHPQERVAFASGPGDRTSRDRPQQLYWPQEQYPFPYCVQAVVMEVPLSGHELPKTLHEHKGQRLPQGTKVTPPVEH